MYISIFVFLLKMKDLSNYNFSQVRKSVVFIAVSLDGYIAGPDEDLSFLDSVQREGEDYGYADFMNTVDTIVMGRRTYDWIMRHVPVFPYSNLDAYVLTRSARPDQDRLWFCAEEPADLVRRLKSESGKDIYINGGAQIVHNLLKHDLVDEWILSIIPVLLGNGIPLFYPETAVRNLQLQSLKHFDSGLVQLHYIRVHGEYSSGNLRENSFPTPQMK